MYVFLLETLYRLKAVAVLNIRTAIADLLAATTGQTNITDREKCHAPTCRYQTAPRNLDAMVKESGTGRGGIRRLRPPRIRVQSCLSGFQLDRGGHLRPRAGS